MKRRASKTPKRKTARKGSKAKRSKPIEPVGTAVQGFVGVRPAALILCPRCKLEMRLFGIEPESKIRDVFTFECCTCGQLEVRGVLVTPPP